jgi:hypothetical protein
MTPLAPGFRIVIVTYNLKGAATGYTAFYEAIKAQGTWWHYLPSTWLIVTSKTPSEITKALRVCLLTGDHLFVGTLQDGYSGWLPKDAWEWLQNHGLNAWE